MSIAEGLGGIFEDPSLLSRANTWAQPQNFPQQMTLINGAYIGHSFGGNGVWINLPANNDSGIGTGGNGGNPWIVNIGAAGNFVSNAKVGDVVIRNTDGRVLIGPGVVGGEGGSGFGYQLGVSAVASAPTLVSGTIYQNTTASYQTLYVPAYASTSGTAGTVALALGTSSTPSTIATEYVSGSTSSSAAVVMTVRIPPQWYYSLTTSGATLGTITQIQE